jgi:1-pyrroline-5-carboxylate dehydrogenase
MSDSIFKVPVPSNEPVLSYASGSKERNVLLSEYRKQYNQTPINIPMYIGKDRVETADKRPVSPPHDHGRTIAYYNFGGRNHVEAAINSALQAREKWSKLGWEQRAAIFLKAADLLAGPWRAKMNAATMLAQSKNAYQAEIDAACEMIDFFRFNAAFMEQIYRDQPGSNPGVWNRMEYRALEGFVFAITPFNFTSIAANLPAAPAMMGNVVVWKPAESQVYSAQVIMELLLEAGLPEGVINMVMVPGSVAGEMVFSHPDFAGLHFTGSTEVFNAIWKTVGLNIDRYKNYPRIVGETGGKDFIIAHPTADPMAVATAISRGAFEFQGQKCSAASRAYLPSNLAPAILDRVKQDVSSFKMGSPEDFGNFINAVIDEKAFRKISEFIDYARQHDDAEIIAGGRCDDQNGWFIEPTVILTKNPHFRTMCEEIFGPVITVYIYPELEFDACLNLLDNTSAYGLTGALFARDRYAIDHASAVLKNAAGNFYINDKPTGAVVGQQPFGGARSSGTNDKAGSYLNLIRWVSPRTIKETWVPPVDYRYPFLE